MIEPTLSLAAQACFWFGMFYMGRAIRAVAKDESLEELGMGPSTILKFIENPEVAEALGEADLESLKSLLRVKKKSWFRRLWGD